MTGPMIAAQEQRLARIAELHRIEPAARTILEWGAIAYLARVVRGDAARNGGRWRINR